MKFVKSDLSKGSICVVIGGVELGPMDLGFYRLDELRRWCEDYIIL